MSATYQSDVRPIKTMVMKHIETAFQNQEEIDAWWEKLFYMGRPDYQGALNEYKALIDLLESFHIDIQFLPSNGETGLDSLYARDASIATNKGMILCNMGKQARRGEPDAQRRFFQAQGIPILGSIDGDGSIEGGDVAWVDEETLAVARGYRTNDAGIQQLKDLLGDAAEVVVVDMPHFRGPDDVLHLMSVYSPLADDLAVIYSPLMPVRFRDMLKARGIRFVEVPEEEYDSLGCNVLALAPNVALTVAGNPITHQRLLDAGAEIHQFSGQEISYKGCGGPTCLTRPLIRD